MSVEQALDDWIEGCLGSENSVHGEVYNDFWKFLFTNYLWAAMNSLPRVNYITRTGRKNYVTIVRRLWNSLRRNVLYLEYENRGLQTWHQPEIEALSPTNPSLRLGGNNLDDCELGSTRSKLADWVSNWSSLKKLEDTSLRTPLRLKAWIVFDIEFGAWSDVKAHFTSNVPLWRPCHPGLMKIEIER